RTESRLIRYVAAIRVGLIQFTKSTSISCRRACTQMLHCDSCRLGLTPCCVFLRLCPISFAFSFHQRLWPHPLNVPLGIAPRSLSSIFFDFPPLMVYLFNAPAGSLFVPEVRLSAQFRV